MKCEATLAMEAARAGLVSRHPSLGYLTFKLNWFADPTCPTAWTDGVSVGFNPDYVMSLNKGRRRFLAAHEVGHPMFGHHLRRGDRDPKKWNIACDHVVNLILVKQGFKLIEGALLDYQFEGMAVEQVYNILFPPGSEDEDQDQGSTESGQNGDSSPDNEKEDHGDGSDQEDGSEGGNDADGSDKAGEGDSDQASGTDGQDGEQSEEDSGSGKEGRAGSEASETDGGGSQKGSEAGDGETEDGPSDLPDSDPGGCGEVRDYPGETPEDFDMEAEKWDMAVQQAAQMERRLSPEGNLPGFVETLLDNIGDPKLPWTEILSRWLTAKAKSDFTWTRPNTRYAPSGIILPVLESQELGRVALFWDTSCSVRDYQVGDICAETQGILAHFPGVLIDLYHIDTMVQFIERLDQYTDWDEITARGRGGTDFRPGFEAIEDGEDPDPVGVIYMTDGECSDFPEEAPPYPVLWIVVDMPQDFRFEPPFGEVAYYNDF